MLIRKLWKLFFPCCFFKKRNPSLPLILNSINNGCKILEVPFFAYLNSDETNALLERLIWKNNVKYFLFEFITDCDKCGPSFDLFLRTNTTLEEFHFHPRTYLSVWRYCDIFKGLEQNRGIKTLIFSVYDISPAVIRHFIDALYINRTITHLELFFTLRKDIHIPEHCKVYELLNTYLVSEKCILKKLRIASDGNFSHEAILFKNLSQNKSLECLEIDKMYGDNCIRLMNELPNIKQLAIGTVTLRNENLIPYVIRMIERNRNLTDFYMPCFVIHSALLQPALLINNSLISNKSTAFCHQCDCTCETTQLLLDVNKHIVPDDNLYGRTIPREVHLLICRYLKETIIKE